MFSNIPRLQMPSFVRMRCPNSIALFGSWRGYPTKFNQKCSSIAVNKAGECLNTMWRPRNLCSKKLSKSYWKKLKLLNGESYFLVDSLGSSALDHLALLQRQQQ